jgi:hypothetical protein
LTALARGRILPSAPSCRFVATRCSHERAKNQTEACPPTSRQALDIADALDDQIQFAEGLALTIMGVILMVLIIAALIA